MADEPELPDKYQPIASFLSDSVKVDGECAPHLPTLMTHFHPEKLTVRLVASCKHTLNLEFKEREFYLLHQSWLPQTVAKCTLRDLGRAPSLANWTHFCVLRWDEWENARRDHGHKLNLANLDEHAKRMPDNAIERERLVTAELAACESYDPVLCYFTGHERLKLSLDGKSYVPTISWHQVIFYIEWANLSFVVQ